MFIIVNPWHHLYHVCCLKIGARYFGIVKGGTVICSVVSGNRKQRDDIEHLNKHEETDGVEFVLFAYIKKYLTPENDGDVGDECYAGCEDDAHSHLYDPVVIIVVNLTVINLLAVKLSASHVCDAATHPTYITKKLLSLYLIFVTTYNYCS